MRQTLTKKQKQLLDYIKQFDAANGYAPTFREIMEGLGYSSVATVAQHIENLVKKGYLLKRDNEARSVQLAQADVDVTNTQELAVLGMIAAGQPIMVLDNPQETLEVPQFMIKSPNSYVLRVKGDSMINDGIFNGDYIIVREQNTARNGEMVVAMVNGDSATLKRFYHEGERIRLQPANDNMDPIYVEKDQRLEIQGIVTGVIRAF